MLKKEGVEDALQLFGLLCRVNEGRLLEASTDLATAVDVISEVRELQAKLHPLQVPFRVQASGIGSVFKSVVPTLPNRFTSPPLHLGTGKEGTDAARMSQMLASSPDRGPHREL